MDIFIVEYREINTHNESLVVHTASNEDKVVEWIKDNGIDDDQPADLNYYYAAFIMPLDHPGNADNDYLAYFNKYGTKIDTLDEID